MNTIEKTPLGWSVNLLWMILQAASILVEDIDMQLKMKFGDSGRYIQEKKRYMKNYEKSLKDAEHWMRMFGLDSETYKALDGHNGAYTNTVASAKELIRMAMIHVDRAHSPNGSYRAFKALRALPSSGIFPDEYIERFNMKYEVVPYAGDRVKTTNHGEGTLLLHVGKRNWNVKLDDGQEIILNEKQFELL